MDKQKNVTPLYALVTAGFWMSFCICVSYAGEYLSKQLGYTASEYGPIMALGSLIGSVIAPMLGILGDKYKNLTPLKLISPLFAAQVICLILILIFSASGKCIMNTLAFTVFIAVSIPVNTVNLKMCVDLERAGAGLNYSLARGCGSLGFVVISTILGILMEKVSLIVVPLGGLVLILCELPLHIVADRTLKQLNRARPCSAAAQADVLPASPLTVFIRENKRFCLMLLGTVLVFVAHNLDCNFLTEINNALGGTSATMGYLSAFTAVV